MELHSKTYPWLTPGGCQTRKRVLTQVMGASLYQPRALHRTQFSRQLLRQSNGVHNSNLAAGIHDSSDPASHLSGSPLLQGVCFDVRLVGRRNSVLPFGLLETHLHIPSRRDEAVDDRQDEHRNGVEDILSVCQDRCQLVEVPSKSDFSCDLLYVYLHPLMHIGVAGPAFSECNLTIYGADLSHKRDQYFLISHHHPSATSLP